MVARRTGQATRGAGKNSTDRPLMYFGALICGDPTGGSSWTTKSETLGLPWLLQTWTPNAKSLERDLDEDFGL